MDTSSEELPKKRKRGRPRKGPNDPKASYNKRKKSIDKIRSPPPVTGKKRTRASAALSSSEDTPQPPPKKIRTAAEKKMMKPQLR